MVSCIQGMGDTVHLGHVGTKTIFKPSIDFRLAFEINEGRCVKQPISNTKQGRQNRSDRLGRDLTKIRAN